MVTHVPDEHVCIAGQPLPVALQPTVHLLVVASQMRPLFTSPQSTSLTQPQVFDTRHAAPFMVALHELVFVAVHSTQVFVVGEHTEPAAHCASFVHSTQKAGTAPTSQCVSCAVQSESLAHCSMHAPMPPSRTSHHWSAAQSLRPSAQPPWHTAPSQSLPDVASPQSPSALQPQKPIDVTHTGLFPAHTVALVAEHSAHAPLI